MLPVPANRSSVAVVTPVSVALSGRSRRAGVDHARRPDAGADSCSCCFCVMIFSRQRGLRLHCILLRPPLYANAGHCVMPLHCIAPSAGLASAPICQFLKGAPGGWSVMRPSKNVAWEPVRDGYLLMRLDTGKLLRLTGEEAALWASVLRADKAPLPPILVVQLLAWGAVEWA